MTDQGSKTLMRESPLSQLNSSTTKTTATKSKNVTSSSGQPKKSQALVPQHCTLDGFAEASLRQGGLDVVRLMPLTDLIVHTQNSLYEITLLDPVRSEVLVRGGDFFVEPTKAVLCGSSFGGSFLKSRWIGIGMRLEICGDGRNIVTSPVVSVDFQDGSDLPGPF